VQFADIYGNLAPLTEDNQDAIAAMLCYDGTAPALVMFSDAFESANNAFPLVIFSA
jgi:hypothetical protein